METFNMSDMAWQHSIRVLEALSLSISLSQYIITPHLACPAIIISIGY